jgi:hypothetical protein
MNSDKLKNPLLIIGLGLLIIFLLINNSTFSFFSGAESFGLKIGRRTSYPRIVNYPIILSFVPDCFNYLGKFLGYQHFPIRFINVLLFIGAIPAYFRLLIRVFDKEKAILIVLFLATSLLLPSMAKIASGDVLLFIFQGLAILYFLCYCKSSFKKDLTPFWITLVIATFYKCSLNFITIFLFSNFFKK